MGCNPISAISVDGTQLSVVGNSEVHCQPWTNPIYAHTVWTFPCNPLLFLPLFLSASLFFCFLFCFVLIFHFCCCLTIASFCKFGSLLQRSQQPEPERTLSLNFVHNCPANWSAWQGLQQSRKKGQCFATFNHRFPGNHRVTETIASHWMHKTPSPLPPNDRVTESFAHWLLLVEQWG